MHGRDLYLRTRLKVLQGRKGRGQYLEHGTRITVWCEAQPLLRFDPEQFPTIHRFPDTKLRPRRTDARSIQEQFSASRTNVSSSITRRRLPE